MIERETKNHKINFFSFPKLPGGILFIGRQIAAWRRLIFCFDAMTQMIIVHLIVVVVILLACIFSAVLAMCRS